MINYAKIRPSIALLIYLIIAFFPGCLCAHFLRIASISDQPATILVGIGFLILPFAFLAFLLIFFTNKDQKIANTITNKSRRSYILAGLMLLALATIAFIRFISNSVDLYDILLDETQSIYTGNSSLFYAHLIAAWIGSYIFGLAVLFIGLFLSFRQREHKG